MQNNKRKQSLRSVSARVLVLGHKQAGKSASIVRFTTGRFIENYSHSTQEWLYKHELGFDEEANIINSVELLEQKDVNQQILSTNNEPGLGVPIQAHLINHNNNNLLRSPLAERVALDKQNDQNNYERQQLLCKLGWADAFVVMYSIDDLDSFIKAIKYMELISNNSSLVNNGKNASYDQHQHPHQQGQVSSSAKRFRPKLPSSSSSSISSITNSQSISTPLSSSAHNNSNAQTTHNSPASSISSSSFSSPTTTLANNQHNQSYMASGKCKPILLLGNKCDLDSLGARQVSSDEARLVAVRHQCLFAELTIKMGKQIEKTLANLLAQINPHNLHSVQLQGSDSSSSESQNVIMQHQQQNTGRSTRLDKWQPPAGQVISCLSKFCNTSHANNSGGGPVLANIVRTVMPQMLHYQSQMQASSSLVLAPGQQQQASLLDKRPVTKSTCTGLSGAYGGGAETNSLRAGGSRQRLAKSTCSTVNECAAEAGPHSNTATRLGSCEQLGPVAESSSARVADNKLEGLSSAQAPHKNQRLSTLRGSFRKASMAIVGGRVLAAAVSGGGGTSRKNSKGGGLSQLEGAAAVAASVVAVATPGAAHSCKRNSTTSTTTTSEEGALGSARTSLASELSLCLNSLPSGGPPSDQPGLVFELNPNNKQPKSFNSASSTTTTTTTSASASSAAANWLRNHIKLGGNLPSLSLVSGSGGGGAGATGSSVSSGTKQQRACIGDVAAAALGSKLTLSSETTTTELLPASPSAKALNSNKTPTGASGHSSGKFYKRPLFKYRTRRETVAFDQIPATFDGAPTPSDGKQKQRVQADRSSLDSVNKPANLIKSLFTASNAVATTASGGGGGGGGGGNGDGGASSLELTEEETLEMVEPAGRSDGDSKEISRPDVAGARQLSADGMATAAGVNEYEDEDLAVVQTSAVGSVQMSATSQQQQTLATTDSGASINAACYEANRLSSGRSSSSLSTSDTYYTSSVFIVCDRQAPAALDSRHEHSNSVALELIDFKTPATTTTADNSTNRSQPLRTTVASSSAARSNPSRASSSAGSMSLCSSTNSSSGCTGFKATPDCLSSFPERNLNSSRTNLNSRASLSTRGSFESSASEDEQRSWRSRNKLLPDSGNNNNNNNYQYNQSQDRQPPGQSLRPISSAVVKVVQAHNAAPKIHVASSEVATGLARQAAATKPTSRRYQLVRSVQNTINHLTRHTASYQNNSSAQVAKKSFCNALFKYSTQPPQPNSLSASESGGNSKRAPIYYKVAKVTPAPPSPGQRTASEALALNSSQISKK